jgi:glycosyltransferase involved in cell wall biosynthesis
VNQAPLVSAVIPVYNREQYLAETIESWLAQRYRPVEVVVVDDGSTDRSVEVAGRFGSVVRCVSQPHTGIAAARNRTLELARGTYLAFLDSDDLWEQDQLAVQMDVLRQEPHLDQLFGHVVEFISPDLPPEEAARIQCDGTPIPSQGVGAIIRADAFQRVGTFHSPGKVGEFLDWQSRARDYGLTSRMLPQVVLRRRLHATNLSRPSQSSRLDYVRILKASLDRRRDTK